MALSKTLAVAEMQSARPIRTLSATFGALRAASQRYWRHATHPLLHTPQSTLLLLSYIRHSMVDARTKCCGLLVIELARLHVFATSGVSEAKLATIADGGLNPGRSDLRKLDEDDGSLNNYPIVGQGPEFKGTSLTSSVAKILSAKLMHEYDDI